MSSVETYSDALELHSTPTLTVDQSSGKFIVTAQLHSSKIINRAVLKQYHMTGINKEVRTFHISPETDVRSFVGVVDDISWNDEIGEPMVALSIFDDTKTAKKVRKILLEDMEKPLKDRRIKGISAGIYVQRNKNNEIVKFHIREVSLAREPVCEECTIQSIITYEKGSTMSENKGYVEIFEKLEGRFNATMDAQSELIDELKAKVERYSKTIVMQEERIGELEGVVTEGKTAIETFEKTVAEKEVAIENATKDPLIKSIMTFEKFDTKTDEGKKRLERLQKLNADALSAMIEGFDRQKKLAAKGLSKSAPVTGLGIMDGNQMTIAQYDKMTPEQRLIETNKMIDGVGTNRKPGEHMGPIEGGF